jgi:EAL domain-containing protein (putative c-di-GMP-specific phosphodiesterase class I)
LVIDDDEFVCKVISAQFQSLCDAQVTTSFGDADTVRLLNEGGPFDLIVSDLSMPRFDGIQLMRLMAVRQSKAAILFISSSGHKLLSAAKELARNRGLHVLPTLEKPLSREDLRRTLLMLDRSTSEPCARTHAAKDAPSVAELSSAIKSVEIDVYVQPQVYANTGKLYGVEALARWNSISHGFVPPNVFVKMAEENDLIDELTDLVLKKSLNACSEWNKAGLTTRVSVNAPISSVSNLMFPETVAALINRYRLNANQLTMEITETGIVVDQDRALDVLTRLRLRGIGLAIDDFGCGHSTYQQIRRLPFNELKIDCSFVFNMFSDQDSFSIVKSSLGLAHEMDMHAVAEGVETSEHRDALAQMGCDILQGYFFAKPFPAMDLPAWVARGMATKSEGLQLLAPNNPKLAAKPQTLHAENGLA